MKPELKDTGLSRKTFDFIYKWSWDKYFIIKKVSDIPNSIIQELSKFKPPKPVILYRGLIFEDLPYQYKRRLKSFTYEYTSAEIIAGLGSKGGYIYKVLVDPKNILVDITRIPNWEKYWINEVIVKTYKPYISVIDIIKIKPYA